MLVAIIIVLTAMVQAAAISKSIRPNLSSEPVGNRSALIHNFALVCVYDRDATNFCQKHFGYGCDSSGKKRTVLYNENCDILCQCINLAPKPACMIGLTGQSWCLRAVEQDSITQGQEQEQEHEHDQEVLTVADVSPKSPLATTTDLAFSKLPPDPVSSSPSMSARPSRIVQAADLKPSSEASTIPQSKNLFFHNFQRWVMLCAGEDATTTDCSRSGYYCDYTGSIQAPNYPGHHCSNACACVDRLSTCSVNEDDVMKCDDGGVQEASVVRYIVRASPWGYPIVPRDVSDANQIPHNFAMVCASDKQETTFCQQDGYYCSGNGKIVIPALPNKYCSDYCVCIDVGVKMHCMLANSGAIYCLRSETNSDVNSPDQVQQTPPAIDAVRDPSKVTKRSEVPLHDETADHTQDG